MSIVEVSPNVRQCLVEAKCLLIAQRVLENLTDLASIACPRKNLDQPDVVGTLSQRSVLVLL